MVNGMLFLKCSTTYCYLHKVAVFGILLQLKKMRITHSILFA